MIIESKVVEDNQSRAIHVSRRGSNVIEKWIFLEQDDQNYQISSYEKIKDSDDSSHTVVGVYSITVVESSAPSIGLDQVPLPDDLVVEIARIRRKIGN